MDTGYRDDKGRFTDGNPGSPGRPKFSVLAIIKGRLEGVPEGEKRPLAELMVDEYIARVRETGDGVAMRDIIDRYDGKPKQTVHLENDKDSEWLEWLKGREGEAKGDER